MTALVNYFMPKTNVVAERHASRNRAQMRNEAFLQYVTTLRELTFTCDFGDPQDDTIHDQLVEHLNILNIDQRIREGLWMDWKSSVLSSPRAGFLLQRTSTLTCCWTTKSAMNCQ